MEERMELASTRLREWIEDREADSLPAKLRDYMLTQGLLLEQALAVCCNPKTMANPETNRVLYDDIRGDAYESSFTNPEHCAEVFADHFGEQISRYLNWIAAGIRDVITASYEKDDWTLVIWLEFFLELNGILKEEIDGDEESLSGALKNLIYYFIHDYDEERIARNIRDLVEPKEEGLIHRLVMERDHKDISYLYEYGEPIGENEIQMATYLSAFEDEELEAMARTYTEGYRKGFEAAGIDLSQKETVEIRYPIGMEAMVKKAVEQFAEMGLRPAFRRKTNTQAIGVVSTPPNRQYLHDHRFDDAVYINNALTSERLKLARSAFETLRDEAYVYAGPAVIETFGEELFVPKKAAHAPKYTKEQEELSRNYRRDYMLLQDEFIPGDKRSFTIIAYPVPEIGANFRDIFHETVKLNTLDSELYRGIQQAIIDTLDEGEYVRVTGRGENRTDMKVMLHTLEDPARQTNFENCVADVNIPVGEVFTSPVLTGTEGTLHVSWVYLNGLRYEDLCFVFHDGKVTEYSCGNYENPNDGKAYIRENVLFHHETLPIGEFAIGTNTTAYRMGRRFGIEAKLPILIAEKTGPHFALGDTCYSLSEEVVVHNPDGKEIIAKDNECSILRKEDPSRAYFQCHTDITIPYDELGTISVFTKEGKETIIIRDGRFVLPGTEGLNKPLDNM